MQKYNHNHKQYQILTPNGLEQFDGIIKNKNVYKDAITIKTQNNTVIATLDHKFFNKDKVIITKDLSIGDTISTIDGEETIISLEPTVLKDTYDIFNTDSHKVLYNNFHAHQCDELAFVRPSIASEFMASMAPTLSCVSGDTLIYTTKGMVTIASLLSYKEEGEYFELDESTYGMNGFEPISHGYVSPYGKTKIITLNNGLVLEATLDHPLMTPAGMIPIKDLNMFDFVRVEHGMNLYGKEQCINAYEVGKNSDIIPRVILEGDKETVDAFLHGYMDSTDEKSPYFEMVVSMMFLNQGYEYKDGVLTKLEGNYRYIEIVDIFYGECVTYDFTVPNSHSFLQNGIMGSNTGGECIITSTPATDEDEFSKIWFSAIPSEHSDKWEDKVTKRYSENSLPLEEEDYDTIYEIEDMRVEEEEEEDIEVGGYVSFFTDWRSVPVSPDMVDGDYEYRGDNFKVDMLKSGLTPSLFERDFGCKFMGSDASLLSGAKLAMLRDTVRKPRFVDKHGVKWYSFIKPNTPYAVVMDPSGDGFGDDAAIQVWEIPTLRQVAEWHDNESDQDEQAKMLYRVLDKIYDMQNSYTEHEGHMDVYYSVERNSIGLGIIRVIEHIGEEKFKGIMIDATEISLNSRGESINNSGVSRYRGLSTTAGNKRRYTIMLKQLIETNRFIVVSKELASQLKSFVKSGNSYAARSGKKDDIVMSCVLMLILIDEIRDQIPELDDYLTPDIEDNDEEFGIMLPSV